MSRPKGHQPIGWKSDQSGQVIQIPLDIPSNRGILLPMVNKQTEKKMENQLTVGKLIEVLKRFDPSLPVEMAMNLEYQNIVTEDMIEVFQGDDGPFLQITDTPGY